MQKVDLVELRRLHDAATEGDWVAKVGHNGARLSLFLHRGPSSDGDYLNGCGSDVEFIAAAHNALPSLLDELEAARLEMRWQASVIAECKEEVRELKADYQRLEEIRRDLMERCERMRSIDGLPLDEIAARQITRDRHMKLIGAAEKLEQLAGVNRFRMLDCNDLTEIAAQLRQEAEGK